MQEGRDAGTPSSAAGPILPRVTSAARRSSASWCVSTASSAGRAGAASASRLASAARLALISRESGSASCCVKAGRKRRMSARVWLSATVAPQRCCGEPSASSCARVGQASAPRSASAVAALPATARSGSSSTRASRGSNSGRASCVAMSRSSADSRSAACGEVNAALTSDEPVRLPACGARASASAARHDSQARCITATGAPAATRGDQPSTGAFTAPSKR